MAKAYIKGDTTVYNKNITLNELVDRLQIGICGRSHDINNSDLNDIRYTGFYYGNLVKNAPSGHEYGFLLVIAHNDDPSGYTTQIWFPQGNSTVIFTRQRNGTNGWTSWYDIWTNNRPRKYSIQIGTDGRQYINQTTGWIWNRVQMKYLKNISDQEGYFTLLSDGTVRINHSGCYYIHLQLGGLNTSGTYNDFQVGIQSNGANISTNYTSVAPNRYITLETSGVFNLDTGYIISANFCGGEAVQYTFLEQNICNMTIIYLNDN